jgi:flagellar motor component MotA
MSEERVIILQTRLARLEEDVKKIDSDLKELKHEIKEELTAIRETLGGKIDELKESLTTQRATIATLGKAAVMATGIIGAIGGIIIFLATLFDKIKHIIGSSVP